MAVSKAVRSALERHNYASTHTELVSNDQPISSSAFDTQCEWGAPPLAIVPFDGTETQLRHSLCTDRDTIKHYPTLGIAALQEEQAPIYRVWLLCRYLDKQGQGWLPVSDLRHRLTKKESKLRLFGYRRLRQILAQGHGRFWDWDKDRDRLWLYGAARLADNLEVYRITGTPVLVPVADVTKSIGDFKAHLYGAWHSGRTVTNPISRRVQSSITGIPERTQRHYCQVAPIRRQTNIVIGGKYNPEEVEKQAWQRGRATFQFTDYLGRQGRRGAIYIAWHLPSTYIGPHLQSSKGRLRKINRKLKDLVTNGARGNGGKKVEKLYFTNGANAGRALNRGQVQVAYWPLIAVSKKVNLWAVFSLV
ncbi:MAG: hypothetical protein KJ069_32155 [Anaerolineae bacterium]|nr:hypothetical protein [Anaerolineae bacterium]